MIEEVGTGIDAFGSVAIRADALHGPQTARAIENFSVSGVSLNSHPEFLAAFFVVKKCAAVANAFEGNLEKSLATAIADACDLLLERKHCNAFEVDVFQGGAGTSTNMNVNEVIASLANEKFGGGRGANSPVHPIDHVNMSQSTNDVYPTALRIALYGLAGDVISALSRLGRSFSEKSLQFGKISKLGRTQLQDAVRMTLGDEFDAFAVVTRRQALALGRSRESLLEINLGGTAIGSRIGASDGFRRKVVSLLSEHCRLELRAAESLYAASWDVTALQELSGTLRVAATALSKIANDLRLLASGPDGGLAEIGLPARQVGSSIMPGKVNPVIPEMMNQAAFAIIGGDVTVTLASEAGQLQLNAMQPIIAHTLLSSCKLLSRVLAALDEKCVRDISAYDKRCAALLTSSAAAATEWVGRLGYERVAECVRQSREMGLPVERLLIEAARSGDSL